MLSGATVSGRMAVQRNVMRGLVLGGVALTLGACSSFSGGNEKPVDPNIYPANYKTEILNTLRQTLSDPVHVRGGLISGPVLTPIDKNQRYTACVRFEERDIYSKQYSQPKDYIAYFYGGHLNQLVKAPGDECAKAAYMPFPEVEKMCLAKKCE